MKKLSLSVIVLISFMSLQAHVQLNYPQGGEVFDPGQAVTIEWEELIAHDTQNWDLYYSNDGGMTWQDLQLDINPDSLTYDWTVPSDATTQARIRVVQDNTGANYEDASGDFTITDAAGISPADPQTSISVYPNPARDHVFIKTQSPGETISIRVFNTAGTRVSAHEVGNRTSGDRIIVPLGDLKPGIYLISVVSPVSRHSSKLVIY